MEEEVWLSGLGYLNPDLSKKCCTQVAWRMGCRNAGLDHIAWSNVLMLACVVEVWDRPVEQMEWQNIIFFFLERSSYELLRGTSLTLLIKFPTFRLSHSFLAQPSALSKTFASFSPSSDHFPSLFTVAWCLHSCEGRKLPQAISVTLSLVSFATLRPIHKQ